MAALAIFLLGALILAAITFTGGWHLRGLRDRYRAEVALAEARGALHCGASRDVLSPAARAEYDRLLALVMAGFPDAPTPDEPAA